MAQSGIETAIRELEMETERIRQAISVLRGILPQATSTVVRRKGAKRGPRVLSPEARRSISMAAKKRWAALRAAKAKG
jgi:hypothetical protein